MCMRILHVSEREYPMIPIEIGSPPTDFRRDFFYFRGVEKFTKFINNIGMFKKFEIHFI